MTRKVNEIETIEPTLSTERAIELIKRQMDQIDGLMQLDSDDPEVKKWDNITEQIIVKTFGKPHDNIGEYSSVRYGGSILISDDYDSQSEFINNLKKVKKLLEGFIEQLEIFSPIQAPTLTKVISPVLSKKIFIVHGHDNQAQSELALIISRLGLEPIILHEQANEGMTLIEKLEKHSNVGYAFVILTPDDAGSKIDQTDNLKSRARQNVVFEFGIFVGKLDRSRVCCLYKGDVELPSDLNGLVYIPFTDSVNEKQIDIIKELKAVGYDVNI